MRLFLKQRKGKTKMTENEDKKLQQQKEISKKGEEKTNIILKSLLSKSIKNLKEGKKA